MPLSTRSKVFFVAAAVTIDGADFSDKNGIGDLLTTVTNDVDRDGVFDTRYSFGARSFSLWDASGEMVWDSGHDFAVVYDITTPDSPRYVTYTNNRDIDRQAADFGDIDGDYGPEGIAFVSANSVRMARRC